LRLCGDKKRRFTAEDAEIRREENMNSAKASFILRNTRAGQVQGPARVRVGHKFFLIFAVFLAHDCKINIFR
jgi:acyl-[acyl carrier protein]--UDP-N-acetylglucosamine O-acyltransferase